MKCSRCKEALIDVLEHERCNPPLPILADIFTRYEGAFRRLAACDGGTAHNCPDCRGFLLNGESCETCAKKAREEGEKTC